MWSGRLQEFQRLHVDNPTVSACDEGTGLCKHKVGADQEETDGTSYETTVGWSEAKPGEVRKRKLVKQSQRSWKVKGNDGVGKHCQRIVMLGRKEKKLLFLFCIFNETLLKYKKKKLKISKYYCCTENKQKYEKNCIHVLRKRV